MITAQILYHLAFGTKTRAITWDRLGESCVRTRLEDMDVRIYCPTPRGQDEFVLLAMDAKGCDMIGSDTLVDVWAEVLEGIFDDAKHDRVFTGRAVEMWMEDVALRGLLAHTRAPTGPSAEMN